MSRGTRGSGKIELACSHLFFLHDTGQDRTHSGGTTRTQPLFTVATSSFCHVTVKTAGATMFSSLLGRLGLSSSESSGSFPPSGGPPLAAGAHVWCLARLDALLFAGDADGAIHIWRVADDEKTSIFIGKFAAHEGTVYALHARPGMLVSAGTDGLCAWKLGPSLAQLSSLPSDYPQRLARAAFGPGYA